MNKEQRERIVDLANEVTDLKNLLLVKPMTDREGHIFSVNSSDQVIQWQSDDLLEVMHKIRDVVDNIDLLTDTMYIEVKEAEK